MASVNISEELFQKTFHNFADNPDDFPKEAKSYVCVIVQMVHFKPSTKEWTVKANEDGTVPETKVVGWLDMDDIYDESKERYSWQYI